MLILVSDANILIDFEEGGLSNELFRLKAVLAVPDVLYYEELEERHSDLRSRGLELRTLDPRAVLRAVGLASTYRRASRNDLLALALAEQEGCPLLTGDAALRQAATVEGVEVHGTLWLAERLVAEGVTAPARLRDAYAVMKDAGRRLPWAEVDRQLKRLSD